MTFSLYLKKKRMEKALTQNQAAKRIGNIKHQFISNIERGTSKPSLGVLQRMCAVYNVEQEEMKRQYIQEAMRSARVSAEEKWNCFFSNPEVVEPILEIRGQRKVQL